MTDLLPLFIVLPLAGGFLAPLLARRNEEGDGYAARGLALVIGAVLLAGSIGWVGRGPAVYWIGGWPSGSRTAIGLSLVSDGLSQLLLLMVNAIAFLSILYSWSYIRRFTGQAYYYCLFLIMLAGMNGVVLSGDLFNVFVFMEVAVIASYALVAFGVERPELEASFKYVILGSVSSLFVFLGIGLLYNLTGQLNMALIAQRLQGVQSIPAVWFAAACFIMGFGLKAALVPFHAWLPDAHPSAPAPISAMLSGVLIKAVGVYVVCRILFNVFGTIAGAGALYANVLMTLGTLSMVIGVFLAIGQWDFKRLLAYHSISQMGYVFLSIGIGAAVLASEGPTAVAALAIFGGLFHLVNHAAFKSLLFLCSGSAEYATYVGLLSCRRAVDCGCAAVQRFLEQAHHHRCRRLGGVLAARHTGRVRELYDAAVVHQSPALCSGRRAARAPACDPRNARADARCHRRAGRRLFAARRAGAVAQRLADHAGAECAPASAGVCRAMPAGDADGRPHRQ
jgi:multicomponent Na+:H+ antiporter subunit D